MKKTRSFWHISTSVLLAMGFVLALARKQTGLGRLSLTTETAVA